MNITILSVDVKTVPTTKGSYQAAEIAYKNNTFQGKVEGKKLMSFGAGAETFKVLSIATSGATFEIDVVKNDKGFNDWVKATPAIAGAAPTSAPVDPSQGMAASKSATQVRSTYETPEERAAKQVYIVRQSSVSNAVAILSVGAKAAPDVNKVLEVARQLENYVFDKKDPGPSGFEDLPDFDYASMIPKPE